MNSAFARRLAATAAVLLAPALASPGHAADVRMFDRPPTVSEVQELLSAPAPRYRSIEIVGAAGKAAQNAAPAPAPAAYTAPAPAQQVVPAVAEAPVPRAEVAAAPPVPPVPEVDEKAFGFRINFAFDSAVIPAESFDYIDTVGQVLRDAPDISIKVEGHTDASGSDAYNQALSEKRARAVAEYLVGKHRIAGSRIRAVGMGEGHPLMENPLDKLNRRVQFARVN
ncbi:OmpA family protein [Skermanella pratensis]|uniref:OmpA family protein n=1 Tax=Skermanella pratensis TaxID=2233999 RepID=UPI001300F27D|nr:OmpA family protein [Skermanella pratensis]